MPILERILSRGMKCLPPGPLFLKKPLCFCFAGIIKVEAAGNTESNRGLEEEGMCGDVAAVRIELRVAGEVTAGVILELDGNVVGELVLCGWWWW